MKRVIVVAALAALLFALTGPTEAAPADRARLQAMLNRLESTLINIDFEDTNLDDALAFIQRFTGVNLIVSPKLRSEMSPADMTFNIRLTEVSARQALGILLEFKDLGMVFRNGVLQVTTKADSRGKPVLRIYSIADLTFPIRDFPGPDLQLRPAGAEFELEEETTQRDDPFEDPEFIIDIIRSNVDPDTWEAEDVNISSTRKVLLIKQSPAVHAKIARLLMLLRAAK